MTEQADNLTRVVVQGVERTLAGLCSVSGCDYVPVRKVSGYAFCERHATVIEYQSQVKKGKA